MPPASRLPIICPVNVYCDLTRRFNAARTRAILAGGQAVVLHHLAIMSKDGDWILREDDEALAHVLSTLDACGARDRFGAPLDLHSHGVFLVDPAVANPTRSTGVDAHRLESI